TSRLIAPARPPSQAFTRPRHPDPGLRRRACDGDDGYAAKRCARNAHPGALPRPVHQNARRSVLRPIPDPRSLVPSRRPTTGQRAGRRGCGGTLRHRKSLIDALRQPVPIFSEPKDLLRVRILLASVAASASGRCRVLGTRRTVCGLLLSSSSCTPAWCTPADENPVFSTRYLP